MNWQDIAALYDRGVFIVVAVLGYAWRVERRLSEDRQAINTLRTQRAEDRDGLDKVLGEIKADIRGLRTDLQDVFKSR